MAQDYYQILGVSRTASFLEVKAAFRRLARKYHPDVNKTQQAEANFHKIYQAYEQLCDSSRRAAYDAQQAQAAPELDPWGQPQPANPAAVDPSTESRAAPAGICWFCAKAQSDIDQPLRVAFRRKLDFGGPRKVWDEDCVEIPLCDRCRRVHRRADRISWVLGVGGAMAGLLPPLIMGVSRVSIGLGIGLGLFSCLLLAWCGQLLGTENTGTRPRVHSIHHPEVQQFLREGFQLGLTHHKRFHLFWWMVVRIEQRLQRLQDALFRTADQMTDGGQTESKD